MIEKYVSKKGNQFGLCILSEKNFADVINLQNNVINNLKINNLHHFIINRSEELIYQELISNTTIVYGMYDLKSSKLASFAMLSLPKDGESRPYKHIASNIPNSKIAILQAMLVEPSFRGNQLMQKMVKVREQAAIDNGRTTLISSVSKDNIRSKDILEKSGFHIISQGLNSRGKETYFIGKAIDNDNHPDFVQKEIINNEANNYCVHSWKPVSNLEVVGMDINIFKAQRLMQKCQNGGR